MRYVLLFILTVLIVVSCKDNNEVKLSGEIKDYKNEVVLITDLMNPDTIPVINGRFEKVLSYDKPVFKYFSFNHKRKLMFFKPGFSLNISFDASNLDSTIKFNGKGAAENVILDSVVRKMKLFSENAYYNMPKESASKYLDSSYNIEKKYITNNVSGYFAEYLNAFVDYNYAYLQLDYGIGNNITDSTYYSFKNKISIENDKYLGIPAYVDFLEDYIEYQRLNSLIKPDSVMQKSLGENMGFKLLAIQNFKNEKIKAFLLYKFIDEKLRYEGLKDFAKFFEYFKKNNKDSVYAAQLDNLYAKKLLLSQGRPAPYFECVDSTNKVFSLKNFKGKYLLIDFWATWCSPCRHEIPYFMQLQKDYKEKEISFVGISVDADKKAWINFLRAKKPEYISLFGGNAWESEAAKAYQVLAIPTFVLIDKEGNIINANAPEPSSNELRKLLDGLLAKK